MSRRQKQARDPRQESERQSPHQLRAAVFAQTHAWPVPPLYKTYRTLATPYPIPTICPGQLAGLVSNFHIMTTSCPRPLRCRGLPLLTTITKNVPIGCAVFPPRPELPTPPPFCGAY